MSNREKYQETAKQYTEDAKLLKNYAGVAYVESKSDVIFWERIFRNFGFKIYFAYHTENKTGSGQCLNYKKYDCLSKDFFICIDSDFRYLDDEQNLDIQQFIFQTYTYSIENHYCFGKGLNQQIEKWLGFENTVFDFEKFSKEYSETVFDFFLDFYQNRLNGNFERLDNFHQRISTRTSAGFPDISENAKNELEFIKAKKTELGFDYSIIETNLADKGIYRENLYLFINGHFILQLFKEISQKAKFLELKKQQMSREETISFFQNPTLIDDVFIQNIAFGKYPEIQKIENDIRKFF